MKTKITALLLFLSISAMAQPDRVHCGKEKTGYLYSNGELYPGLSGTPYARPYDGVWILTDNNWPFPSKYYLNCKPAHELPLDSFGLLAVGFMCVFGVLIIRKQLWNTENCQNA